ncbi:MAG: class I SAM-dependent methyltransferase [Desulfobulbaceae bacterium]|nr:MAG: class I SAM-dependent methyltransferase [Desulfobulbaceae bacterium]
MKYADIDWNRLWQEERRQKSWRRKKKKDWDKRANSFAKRTAGSDFSDLLLAMIAPPAGTSVLDVGCGPGTMAIPLARLGLTVTAMDFSEQMLAQLSSRAAVANLETITTIHGSWTDDWQELGVGRHDLVLAARSLAVEDLRGALEKMVAWARQEIVIVDRVGPGPFDPELFAALGRPFEPGPDFVFTMNILFQMGVTPRLDYLEFDQQRRYADRQEAMDGCGWMVDDLSDAEQQKLAAYVDERLSSNSDGTVTLTRSKPVKWAVIRWNVHE